MQKNKVYMDHQKLVFALAWKFSKKTGMEVEELISEFNLVFCESFEAFDPGRGIKFSNFLAVNCVNRVRIKLKALSRKKRKFEVLVDIIPERVSHNPEDSIILYDNFTNPTNPVIQSITNIISTRTIPKTGFRIWLKKQLVNFGHPTKEIAATFRDLKSLCDPQ